MVIIMVTTVIITAATTTATTMDIMGGRNGQRYRLSHMHLLEILLRKESTQFFFFCVSGWIKMLDALVHIYIHSHNILAILPMYSFERSFTIEWDSGY
jgi:hypothetical protein